MIKTYRFSKEYIVLFVIGLAFFTWISLPPHYTSQPYFLVMICLLFWFKFLITPYRVDLINGSELITKSLIQSKRVALADIEHIKDSMWSVKIIHKNGDIALSPLMNGIKELKHAIETFDPQVEIEDVEQAQFKHYEKNPLMVLLKVIIFVLFLLGAKLFF